MSKCKFTEIRYSKRINDELKQKKEENDNYSQSSNFSSDQSNLKIILCYQKRISLKIYFCSALLQTEISMQNFLQSQCSIH